MINTNDITCEDYGSMLLNLIPFLKSMPYKCGGEGVAYFYGDQFVIKEYCEAVDWESFDEVFDTYCSEIQEYSNMGFNVPKIYSWLKIPNFEYYSAGKKNKYKYYILEEKVDGRNLYYGFLEEFYPICSKKFDKREFMRSIGCPDLNLPTYTEIVREFLRDYVEINEFLESVSETELSDFIVSAYNIHMTSKQGEPDLFPANVFVKENKIKLIDNTINLNTDGRIRSQEYLNNYFITHLVNLFMYNENVSKVERNICYNLSEKLTPDFSDLKKKNVKASKAAITRVLKIMNKYCDNPKMSNPQLYTVAFTTLKNFMGKSNARDIMANVAKTFE